MPDRSLNPALRPRSRSIDADALREGILQGDQLQLSRAITLVESSRPDHQQLARELVEACLPHSGQSTRLAVTGAPGVGKSSFLEAFGMHLLQNGERIAVLAVDPSSPRSKGSILGDKTRMGKLAQDERVFIRPSPAGTTLGGVARHTRETILLCEAAGFSTILVETVGVGQSETTVRSMVDFFLLLLLPGAGDELQGIKRGIVEMADLLVVNKTDGERVKLGRQTRQAYRNALHLFPPSESGWTPEVLTCSSTEGTGIPAVAEAVERYRKQMQASGYWTKHRREQARFWLYESIQDYLKQQFYSHPEVKKRLPEIEGEVLEGRQSSFAGAEHLIRLFREAPDV